MTAPLPNNLTTEDDMKLRDLQQVQQIAVMRQRIASVEKTISQIAGSVHVTVSVMTVEPLDVDAQGLALLLRQSMEAMDETLRKMGVEP